MTALYQNLSEKIAQSGAISIADYMAETVRHYYATSEPFGVGGDFTTAPEISQMFGEMIGLWCAQMWQTKGKQKSVLAELGPGRGTLMKDILRAGAIMPGFVEALSVHFVEQSARLQQIQKDNLPQARWVGEFSDLPSGFLLLIANEFFDSLPIRQFKRTEKGWRENCVSLQDGRFVFSLSPTPPDIALEDAPVGTIAEICPQGEALIQKIAQRLQRTGGAALVIDYGNDQTIFGDSLQAVQNHQFCPVLKAGEGEADITAHVRFGHLADIARAQGAIVDAVMTQAEFLQSLGITTRAAQLAETASAADRHDIQTSLARLINPDQMGDLFKVMVLR